MGSLQYPHELCTINRFYRLENRPTELLGNFPWVIQLKGGRVWLQRPHPWLHNFTSWTTYGLCWPLYFLPLPALQTKLQLQWTTCIPWHMSCFSLTPFLEMPFLQPLHLDNFHLFFRSCSDSFCNQQYVFLAVTYVQHKVQDGSVIYALPLTLYFHISESPILYVFVCSLGKKDAWMQEFCHDGSIVAYTWECIQGWIRRPDT